MTTQYTQTVQVTIDKRARAAQLMGLAAFLLAFAFLMIAAFVNWYFMIGCGVFIILGALEIHFFNLNAREYTYSASKKRLVIAKKDVVGKQARIADILFDDVSEFGIFDGVADADDILACQSGAEAGAYQLIFKVKERLERLIFKPDEYMTELILVALKGGEEEAENEQ